MSAIGVLLMAYGGPDSLADVEPYLLDVRGHRPTPPALVEAVRHRYERIGGRSPIRERTAAQAAALQRSLDARGAGFAVLTGMRHWHPYIRETLGDMRQRGIRRAVGLVLAPHHSRLSIGGYRAAAEAAADGVELRFIEQWHLLPGYLRAMEAAIATALARIPEPQRACAPVIFTAHSLPQRIASWDDPYPGQLAETRDALQAALGGRTTYLAYQSASHTGEPWLGPDVAEVVSGLANDGCRAAVVAPIGFVSEHVEILFDLDIELQEQAAALGITIERAPMLNDAPALMAGLAALVRAAAQEAGWQ